MEHIVFLQPNFVVQSKQVINLATNTNNPLNDKIWHIKTHSLLDEKNGD